MLILVIFNSEKNLKLEIIRLLYEGSSVSRQSSCFGYCLQYFIYDKFQITKDSVIIIADY